MISNVCVIEKGTKDLGAILAEAEKVAVYNGLDKKQTMHLRLLCEELDGMLPEIIGDFEGKLWIEMVDGVCKINASMLVGDITSAKKSELIKVSKNKKNAAAVGIAGKIRNAIENLMMDLNFSEAFVLSASGINTATGFYVDSDYTDSWSLCGYKKTVEKDKDVDEWDELEKSVIATVADDVIVGVKGSRADIIIVKTFK